MDDKDNKNNVDNNNVNDNNVVNYFVKINDAAINHDLYYVNNGNVDNKDFDDDGVNANYVEDDIINTKNVDDDGFVTNYVEDDIINTNNVDDGFDTNYVE